MAPARLEQRRVRVVRFSTETLGKLFSALFFGAVGGHCPCSRRLQGSGNAAQLELKCGARAGSRSVVLVPPAHRWVGRARWKL